MNRLFFPIHAAVGVNMRDLAKDSSQRSAGRHKLYSISQMHVHISMPEIMVCSGQNEQSYITDEFRHIKFIENFQISKQLDVGGVQPVNLA